MNCKCCGRNKELRLGFCFDCVESESIISTKLDMYDNPINKEEDLSQSMSELKYILNKYLTEHRVFASTRIV